MANEIRSSAVLSVSVSGDSVTSNGTATLSLTGTKYIKNIQSVGNTVEQVDFADLSSCKCIYLRNLGSTYISCSVDNAGTNKFAVLYPYTSSVGLDYALFTPFNLTQSIYLKSHTGTSDVSIVATEL
jgi:hypothetical protein